MKQLIQLLIQRKLTIAVAESCTGGNLSALLTSESGSSAYFDRGFITYSNQAKIDMLGVKTETLKEFGAVSEQTAMEMVQGVIKKASTDIGVSITGIAGPKSDDTNKPVGMVCFGFYIDDKYFTAIENFSNQNRMQVVQSSVEFVTQILVAKLKKIGRLI
ncbi:MAG: Nicotinamide-nucleotide amidohydrolase PncC [Catillopecten margaritatus gill symbiont]|uniref:Nicotinamide-nucleotide amidohydrolase PncC n=1 Tax=Catillopecten margaritatus gill symbiont TaxID=3083288 RepID=A0AAU6PG53_9GAMM